MQPKSTNYYYLQKPPLPPPYRRSPVDQEPQLNKQVHFLESPETHHQSQVRFLHPLYPKESNPHLHLDPAPWYHPPPQYQQAVCDGAGFAYDSTLNIHYGRNPAPSWSDT